jgi:hypothetical protein
LQFCVCVCVCVCIYEAPLFDGLMESARAGVYHNIQFKAIAAPLDQYAQYTRVYVRVRASTEHILLYIYICVCVSYIYIYRYVYTHSITCVCVSRVYIIIHIWTSRGRPLGVVWSRNFYFRKFNKSGERGSLAILQGWPRSGDSGVQKDNNPDVCR